MAASEASLQVRKGRSSYQLSRFREYFRACAVSLCMNLAVKLASVLLLVLGLQGCAHKVKAQAECLNLEHFSNAMGNRNEMQFSLGDLLVLNHDAKTVSPTARLHLVPQQIKDEVQPAHHFFDLERYLKVDIKGTISPAIEASIRTQILNRIRLDVDVSRFKEIPNLIQEMNQMNNAAVAEAGSRDTHRIAEVRERLVDAQKNNANVSFVVVSAVVIGKRFLVKVADDRQGGGSFSFRQNGVAVDVQTACSSTGGSDGEDHSIFFRYIPVKLKDGRFVHDDAFAYDLTTYRRQ